MSTAPLARPPATDPSALDDQLWECIEKRLQRGDALVRPIHFQRALEADYAALTGVAVDRAARRRLAQRVVTSNRTDPNRYVALGVRNAVRHVFSSVCTQLCWDAGKISSSGPMAITRFKSQDRVRGLLGDIGVRPNAIDADGCVQFALRVAAGLTELPARRPTAASVVDARARRVYRTETTPAGEAVVTSGDDEDNSGRISPPARTAG